MKCPGCQIIVSDLRDVCPRCHIDLRSHKQLLNLPITNPTAEYDELLARLTNKNSGQPAVGSTLGSVVRSFFGPSSRAEEHKYAAPPSHAQIAPTSDPAPAPENLIVPQQEQIDPIEVDFDLPADLPVQLPSPKFETVERQLTEGFEALERELQLPPREEPAPAAVAGPDHVQVNGLFEMAQREMCQLGLDQSAEFQLEQLAQLANREDIKLLFDMSRDAIINPESEKMYTDEVRISETKHVEAAALSRQLAKVEKLVSAPVMSLRAMRAKSAAKAAAREQAEIAKLEAAKLDVRIRAFLSDVMIVLCAAFGFSFVYALWVDTTLLDKLVGTARLNWSDLIVPGAAFLQALIVLATLYPLLSYMLLNATLGEKSCNILLLRADGRPLTAMNWLVRIFVFPLSILCLGFVPLLFGGKSLHDRLAKTALFRSPA